MKPILQNLLSVIRRFKLATTLNLMGLSVAFAAFMVIMIQLNYDMKFAKFHKDSDRIYRLEIMERNTWQTLVSRPLAERFIESSPHIIAGSLNRLWMPRKFFHVENGLTRDFYEEINFDVTPEYFDVFSFEFIEGNADVLKNPETVIIPLSLAHKLFGAESAVGKQLVHEQGRQTVGAVYRDFPSNTFVNNYIYTAMSESESKNNWGNSNYQAFIRVERSVDVALLIEDFKRNFNEQGQDAPNFNSADTNDDLRLSALTELHFIRDAEYDQIPKASRQTLMILFTIAIVIVAIAAINFTNFNTALTPMRLKSINTQRVLGARLSTLRFVLVVEAMAICFLSYLIAVFFVSLFSSNSLSRLVEADLSLVANPLVIGGTAVIALLTGLLAGVYPSRYMTSFAPALVLKGNFGLSPKGKKLRNTLIGVQFVVSFTLIIGASFMYLQNDFMQNTPLGYHKDGIITANIMRIRSNRDAFADRIQAYAGVEHVTFAASTLSDGEVQSMERIYKDNTIRFYIMPVHHTFLNVMGIEVTDGRGFRQEDSFTQGGAFVFNETARKKFELEMDVFPNNGGEEIIGFMPDIMFQSLHNEVEPMAFCVVGRMAPNVAYIKLKNGANLREAIAYVHTTIAEFDPDYKFFDVRFFDEVLQRVYEKELALSALISLFSFIAIFISIVGVFGLVVFDSECRRREIGIRKVLGASTAGIIFMFNKAYLRILAICFVIAAPLAWYTVNDWLQNFAFKTPMYWWVYLLAFAGVGIITAGTVTFQNWRVANDNPVKAISGAR